MDVYKLIKKGVIQIDTVSAGSSTQLKDKLVSFGKNTTEEEFNKHDFYKILKELPVLKDTQKAELFAETFDGKNVVQKYIAVELSDEEKEQKTTRKAMVEELKVNPIAKLLIDEVDQYVENNKSSLEQVLKDLIKLVLIKNKNLF